MKTRQVLALGILAGGLGCGCGGGAEAPARPAESPETRAIMGRIYEGLRIALPQSVGDEPFSDADRRVEVAAALELLAENAGLLESHATEDDVTRQLARSVARDAREVRDAYARDRFDRAAFLLQQITENCVSCHSRLPDEEERPLAADLLDEAALAGLSPEQRATLQVATRRFDDALDTYEAFFASPESPALMLDALVDYLVVSIRVRGDWDRPLPTLRRFLERDDLWEKLRRDVEFWLASLPELRKRAEGKVSLAVAREIMDEAGKARRFPGGHRAVAHYVVASSLLEQYLAGRSERDADTAEACYRLGVIEAWIGRNYWVSSAPFLLERAIRVSPGAPFAAEAYAVLEEELLLSYEGADDDLPADDRERLAELRGLIDAAR